MKAEVSASRSDFRTHQWGLQCHRWSDASFWKLTGSRNAKTSRSSQLLSPCCFVKASVWTKQTKKNYLSKWMTLVRSRFSKTQSGIAYTMVWNTSATRITFASCQEWWSYSVFSSSAQLYCSIFTWDGQLVMRPRTSCAVTYEYEKCFHDTFAFLWTCVKNHMMIWEVFPSLIVSINIFFLFWYLGFSQFHE